jgi:hypothetical protein
MPRVSALTAAEPRHGPGGSRLRSLSACCSSSLSRSPRSPATARRRRLLLPRAPGETGRPSRPSRDGHNLRVQSGRRGWGHGGRRPYLVKGSSSSQSARRKRRHPGATLAPDHGSAHSGLPVSARGRGSWTLAVGAPGTDVYSPSTELYRGSRSHRHGRRFAQRSSCDLPRHRRSSSSSTASSLIPR